MALSLAQARLTETDKLHAAIIDEFRKNSWVLDNITFDNTASTSGTGSSFGYLYDRVKTEASAATRAINSEYTPQEALVEQFSVVLRVLGGAFEIDRVVAASGGIKNRVAFQFEQKTKAAIALFNDLVINGDSGVDSNAFDGLEKALIGSSTEYDNGVIDLSSSAALDSNYNVFIDELDHFIMGLDGTPSMIAGNTQMIAKLRAAARRAGMYMTTKNDWGTNVESYGGIPFIDMGSKSGSADPIVATAADGTSPLYAVRFGLDGFHAISPSGQRIINVYAPDFSTPGAIKLGEVEMVTAVALKATKAAGVMRGIKVKA